MAFRALGREYSPFIVDVEKDPDLCEVCRSMDLPGIYRESREWYIDISPIFGGEIQLIEKYQNQMPVFEIGEPQDLQRKE
jgi:hypothetical protein